MDDAIRVIEVAQIETAFAGHGGLPFCEVWLKDSLGDSFAMRFSRDTGRAFREKLDAALAEMNRRSTN